MFESLDVERFMVGIGAWCSDEPASKSTAQFDEVTLVENPAEQIRVGDAAFDAATHGMDKLIEPRK